MGKKLVVSFGMKYGGPRRRGINCVVYDLRGFKNPHHDRKLRQLNGLHPLVQKEVLGHRGVQNLIEAIVAESPNVVAFCCTAGRHRSVAVAEEVARRMGADVWHMEKENWP
jgi:UPF0042 nucleotide-binding protein